MGKELEDMSKDEIIKMVKEYINMILFDEDFRNNPYHFHYQYIKEAYENDLYSVVVILLSVFFESVITKTLIERYEFLDEKVKESWSRYDIERKPLGVKLNLSKNQFDFISDETFDIIQPIKDTRNKFAHELESYSLNNMAEIIDFEILDEAIKLYQEWLGITDEDLLIIK